MTGEHIQQWALFYHVTHTKKHCDRSVELAKWILRPKKSSTGPANTFQKPDKEFPILDAYLEKNLKLMNTGARISKLAKNLLCLVFIDPTDFDVAKASLGKFAVDGQADGPGALHIDIS